MIELVFFGALAAALYASWYWWPVSAWVIGCISLYIVVSDERQWWRHDRLTARSPEERIRSYFSHWAAGLGMLETAYRLDGLRPLPDGKKMGSEYRRVVVALIFYVGLITVWVTQFVGESSADLPPPVSTSVSTQEPNPFAPPRDLTDLEQQFVKTNFADDLARCRAFLTIHANGNPGQTTPVTRTPKIDEIDEILAALVGAETTMAKFGLQFEAMSSEMEGDYTNFSRLIVKHAQFCADLQRDPIPRFEYWMVQARTQL